MAMKKAELEAHRQQYYGLLDAARGAERNGLLRDALSNALAAWDYVDGMMQFERRYEDADFDTIEAIELVLKFAPLLLESKSLVALEELLKTQKRIDKNTSVSLADRLAQSREHLWINHRLWSHLAENIGVRQDTLRRSLGGDQDYWRGVCEQWERMGLIDRLPESNSYRLTLLTRTGAVTKAKCPSCAKIVEAPKAMFFEAMSCPACSTSVSFVLLATIHNENT